MIELTIRSETPQGFLAELNALAGVTSVGQVVLAQRASAAQQPVESTASMTAGEQASAESAQTEQNPAPAAETTKPRGRGRPPKADTPAPTEQPKAEPTADASDPGDVPEQFKRNAIDVPKDLDGLRALIQKVCSAKSPEITQAIIKRYGEKTSLVPVEKYPQVAAELHAAMAET